MGADLKEIGVEKKHHFYYICNQEISKALEPYCNEINRLHFFISSARLINPFV